MGWSASTRNYFFLRMRPSNFPTVRIAQLAMLIHSSSHLFTRMLECSALNEVRDLLQVTANDYWHYHYSFDALSSYKIKQTGKHMIDSLLINTVIPLLFAYGLLHDEQCYKDRAMS